MTAVRVLPNVTGLDKEFDYLLPDALVDRVTVGTRVRVPLHGRRVGGWVTAVGTAPTSGAGSGPLKEVTGVTGLGPSPDLVSLAGWAAERWVGRRRHFLLAASPERAVTALPAPARTGNRPEPRSPAATRLLGDPDHAGGVLRIPPSADVVPAVLSAVALGPTLVVAPERARVRLLAGQLRRAGVAVAVVPDEWPAAAAGVDVVVGTRTAAWAPCPGLAAAVVVDEHDEALQEEASPTWHARDVVIERCRRAGARWLLVSPVPTLHATTLAPVLHPPADRERRGWPVVEVVDRRDDVPWRRSLVTSPLIRHLRDHDAHVVCVSNTTGRARLLACRSCRELARCEVCDAAVAQTDDGHLVCHRCGTRRPAACLACRGASFANLRPGVTRLREELEAAAGRAAVAVTARTDDPVPAAGVHVGTEAVLHRVDHADVVAFLDLDAELFAPRHRAAEQALALIARAARLVGPRTAGGRIVLQTFTPGHEVIRAALLGDPDRVVAPETERRRALGLPPFGALAEISGAGAEQFVASLADVESVREGAVQIGRRGDGYLVRASDVTTLGAALRRGERPARSRLRIAVDPPRI